LSNLLQTFHGFSKTFIFCLTEQARFTTVRNNSYPP
jgi:hypothetical protein